MRGVHLGRRFDAELRQLLVGLGVKLLTCAAVPAMEVSIRQGAGETLALEGISCSVSPLPSPCAGWEATWTVWGCSCVRCQGTGLFAPVTPYSSALRRRAVLRPLKEKSSVPFSWARGSGSAPGRLPRRPSGWRGRRIAQPEDARGLVERLTRGVIDGLTEEPVAAMGSHEDQLGMAPDTIRHSAGKRGSGSARPSAASAWGISQFE